MPVIITNKIENARPFDVECDVVVIGQLVEKMAAIGAFIAAAPIVGAAHVGAHSNALIRPARPLPVGIQSDWNGDRFDIARPACWILKQDALSGPARFSYAARGLPKPGPPSTILRVQRSSIWEMRH